MKKFTFAAVAALAVSAAPAFAADMPVKGVRAIAPPPPPAWDIAFGAAIASDYVWRGITQSNHKPAVMAYFEPRYNLWKDLQLYAGMGAPSIGFPNRAAAEIDFYAGIRPTLGNLAFDFGAWYYWYPGGQGFSATSPQIVDPQSTATSSSRTRASGKSTPSGTNGHRAFTLGGVRLLLAVRAEHGRRRHLLGRQRQVRLSGARERRAVLRLGRNRPLVSRNSAPSTTAPADRARPFPNGIPYKSYTTWNLGIGWTWSVFTLDLRYYDTDLNDGDCNAFTSDQTARFTASFTPINLGGFGSSWCGQSFIALSADLTALANLK